MAQPPAPYPHQPPPQWGPQYAPPPPAKKGLSCAVIALIVLAISVPVLGVVASLAIYGVRRYLAAAKTAEAKATVTALASASQAAYERRVAELGDKSGQSLCKSSEPVPSSVPMGTKYASAASDWETGDEATGWKCLKFSISQPQYFQYRYVQGADRGVSGTSPGADGFEAGAQGDVDADGTNSAFARDGRIQSGALVVGTQLYIENEFE